jgi:hypothetical protein
VRHVLAKLDRKAARPSEEPRERAPRDTTHALFRQEFERSVIFPEERAHACGFSDELAVPRALTKLRSRALPRSLEQVAGSAFRVGERLHRTDQ